MDAIFLQNRLWILHVGDHRRTYQHAHRHDERYLSKNTSNNRPLTEMFMIKKVEISKAQSDVEWKFGLAKLVRAMHRTAATPSPLNLFTSWISYLWQLSRKQGNVHTLLCVTHDCMLTARIPRRLNILNAYFLTIISGP